MDAEVLGGDEGSESSRKPKMEASVAGVQDSCGEPTACKEDGGSRKEREGKAMPGGGDCCIDVKGSRNSREYPNGEIECRINHFGREFHSFMELELIQLGCDCEGETGSSHRHCAEAWLGRKGDRKCDICGKTVKNIGSNREEDSRVMMDGNEMLMVAAGLSPPQKGCCKQSFYNLLLACLVLAFLLPWIFKGSTFRRHRGWLWRHILMHFMTQISVGNSIYVSARMLLFVVAVRKEERFVTVI